MRLIGRLLFVLIVFFLLATLRIYAAFPQPVGYVNDFGNMLSASFRQQLESELSNFEQETTAEISVVTIQSLEGNSIEDYAVRLFEQWKIGKKGKDNGVLLLVSKEDRKIKIEVGYGLEPIITDGRAGKIIREDISPAFKNNDYEGGIKAAVQQLEDYIRSNQPPSEEELAATSGSGGTGGFSSLVVFGIIVLFIYSSAFLGRTKHFWPGGVVGGLLGLVIGLAASIVSAIACLLLFGALGLFLDFVLSRNYKKLEKLGRPTGFWRSFGGFSSGGGGGGGGFGGFGGGSSGGGGASGGW
jgi:uncharacterized protein